MRDSTLEGRFGVARAQTSIKATTYKSIDVDRLSIFYREAGSPDAPTLLLLHGFPSSSRMYEPLFARLVDAFHLVALTIHGSATAMRQARPRSPTPSTTLLEPSKGSPSSYVSTGTASSSGLRRPRRVPYGDGEPGPIGCAGDPERGRSRGRIGATVAYPS